MNAQAGEAHPSSSEDGHPLVEAASAVWRWVQLGWYDFIYQHRRTVVGPLWETFQIALWATALIWIFGRFHSDDPAYVPYVITGLIGWGLISSILSGGPAVFTSNASLILNVPNPLALYVVRKTATLMSRFAFQLLIFIPAVLYFKVPLNANTPLALVGVALLAIMAVGSMTVLGVIGARMRDLEQAISAVTRFLFFATPIFWVPAPNTSQALFATYNPVAYALDVLRAPLLGQAPSAHTYLVVGAGAAVSLLAAFLAVRLYGRQVPNWL